MKAMFTRHNPFQSFIAVSLCLAAAPGVVCQGKPPSQGAHRPRFVDLTLAGAHLSLSGNDFHDYSKKGYHLIRQSVSDLPGQVSLALLPRVEATTEGTHHVSLPLLRTGRGVSIGDSPKQVRSLLGTPANIIKPQESEIGELTYDYETIIPLPRHSSRKGSGIKRAYMATYVFHNKHLQSIAYLIAKPDSQ